MLQESVRSPAEVFFPAIVCLSFSLSILCQGILLSPCHTNTLHSAYVATQAFKQEVPTENTCICTHSRLVYCGALCGPVS